MLTVKADEKGEVEDTQIKGIGVKNDRNNSLRNQKGNWIRTVYGSSLHTGLGDSIAKGYKGILVISLLGPVTYVPVYITVCMGICAFVCEPSLF